MSLVIVEVATSWSPARCAEVVKTFPSAVQQRAERYLSDKARQNLVASQWALRAVLDHLQIPQENLAVCPQGRPYLRCESLEFNLSHSEHRAVILFGKGELKQALGVDVEWTPRKVEKEALARRFFTNLESQRVLKNEQSFFQFWTRKEAVLKSNGVGLRVPLNSFEVIEDSVPEEVTGRALRLGTEQRQDGYLVSWAVPTNHANFTPIWVDAGEGDWLHRVSSAL